MGQFPFEIREEFYLNLIKFMRVLGRNELKTHSLIGLIHPKSGYLICVYIYIYIYIYIYT